MFVTPPSPLFIQNRVIKMCKMCVRLWNYVLLPPPRLTYSPTHKPARRGNQIYCPGNSIRSGGNMKKRRVRRQCIHRERNMSYIKMRDFYLVTFFELNFHVFSKRSKSSNWSGKCLIRNYLPLFVEMKKDSLTSDNMGNARHLYQIGGKVLRLFQS